MLRPALIIIIISTHSGASVCGCERAQTNGRRAGEVGKKVAPGAAAAQVASHLKLDRLAGRRQLRKRLANWPA